jgi:hypothetical protein
MLRGLIAELAAASDEDVEAVLSQLGALHRDSVRRLIGEARGVRASAPPARTTAQAEAKPAALRLEGFSPWLAARLERAIDPSAPLQPTPRARRSKLDDPVLEASMRYSMTPGALHALHGCATPLATAAEATESRPGLVRTFLNAFPFARASS